jgi:hypothetical protein
MTNQKATFHLVKGDEAIDDELILRINGHDTNIAVQIAGRHYVATHWIEDDQEMWMGDERSRLAAAKSDAIARWEEISQSNEI